MPPLPSFEGKTALKDGGGAVEALILATDALEGASRRIADSALVVSGSKDMLVLAGDEAIDLGLSANIRAEIEAFAQTFDFFMPSERGEMAALSALGPPVAALTAVAGALRTETEITGIDHSSILSHRVLAIAVAGRLLGRAILPAAATGVRANGALVRWLLSVARRRDEAALAGARLPPAEAEPLKAVVSRFDAFFARITIPDAAGRVPLAEAARLDQLSAREPLVLRVYVDKAGGSFVQRKNLWTTLGRDPLRVTGGLVASFCVADPASGRVLAAEVLNCRTQEARLKDIQSGAAHGHEMPGTSAARQWDAESNLLSSESRGIDMADYFQLAGDAIEAVVIARQPSAQFTWPTIQPKRDWGATDVAWEGWLDDIRSEFRSRIAPALMKAGETFAGSAGKDLSDLRLRLARSVQP